MAPQSEPIKKGQNHASSEAHPLQNQILGAFTFGTFVYFRTGRCLVLSQKSSEYAPFSGDAPRDVPRLAARGYYIKKRAAFAA